MTFTITEEEKLTRDEQKLARMINEYRSTHGLEPLRVSKSLMNVARLHVQDANENFTWFDSGKDERV